MFKKLTLSAILLLTAAITTAAQCTSTPPVIQENSKDIVVYFHADQGNQGLMNQPSTAQIYAHTGVITSASQSTGDWKYAPEWGDNTPKYKLDYVSPNLWKLNIGEIRSYYGITNPNETVTKLAFVFRTADKTAEGKGPNGSDIFLDVFPAGLQASLTSNHEGNVVDLDNPQVTFTLNSTTAANLDITVNGTSIGSANGTTELSANYTFTKSGNYTIVGTATSNGQTATSTLSYIVPVPSQPATYPGGTPKMGAVRNADGSVTFCLAAPGKSSAIIVGNWDNYQVNTERTMAYQDYQNDRYFWITIPNLEKGKNHIYYYLVDGEKRVGDPYARLVLDPYNDKFISADVYPDMPRYPYDIVTDVPMAVFNDNLNNYNWKVTDFKGADKDNLFIYELLFRDFTGTEGKKLGDGTVRKAMEKIPYLKALGVNTVELLPINEFNGNNSWGYNPNFYFAPDKAYGTPDDYKAFIDECHANGIAVILDMVFNQTDWLHPWYQLYPVGQNPFYNATAPHAYSVLNDWNQGYPLVRQQFRDVLKYWIEEYKIDGYRFDLVKGLGNNSSYSNNGDAATNAFNQSRIDNMRDLQLAIEAVKPDAYFINENLAGAQEENAMAEYGQLNWANVNHQGGQFAMGYSSDSALNRFYAPDDSRTWGSTVSYLESHDEQRLAYLQNTNGAQGVKGNLTNSMHRLSSAAAQMMMAPGSHMVWMFSELGNSESTKTANGSNNVDPKTVRWNYYDNAKRRGLYDCYAQLAGIRNANPEMFGRDVTVSMNCGVANWSNGRTIVLTKDNKRIIVAVNPNTSGDPLPIYAPFLTRDNADWQILSQSHETNPTFDAASGIITVEPNCYVVVGSASLTGEDEITVEGAGTSLSVTGGRGFLSVSNAPAAVHVYSLDGTARFVSNEGGNVTVSLPAGVYIIRSGNAASKVVVR